MTFQPHPGHRALLPDLYANSSREGNQASSRQRPTAPPQASWLGSQPFVVPSLGTQDTPESQPEALGGLGRQGAHLGSGWELTSHGLAGTTHTPMLGSRLSCTHLVASGAGAGRSLQLHASPLVTELHLHLLPLHLDEVRLRPDLLSSLLQLTRAHAKERQILSSRVSLEQGEGLTRQFLTEHLLPTRPSLSSAEERAPGPQVGDGSREQRGKGR